MICDRAWIEQKGHYIKRSLLRHGVVVCHVARLSNFIALPELLRAV